jgi:hypothetical protein|tara:strand:- start:68 stop:1213 length:1146 start_codon:yes stop_codon:yes gene_type:complete
MRRSSVREYAMAVGERYRKAGRSQKGKVLDEFIATTGYHRKSAIRLLGGASRARPGQRLGRPPKYGAETKDALRLVWEATDRICGKRLQPFLPELVAKLIACGELDISLERAHLLCELSASSIDRLLRPYKGTGGRRPLSTTKPGSLLKASIPIRTFAEWTEDQPGFLEMDLVAHCGETTEGFYLNTLTAVDIATGWVECQGVWGKGQDRVGGAVHHIAQSLPFPLLGLDSDNGGEFINHHLYSYCLRKQITFTRSRPYKKNDNAHVEQKNWSVVRRLIGYHRYSSRRALSQLQRVYTLVRPYVNFFQPVMKLKHKSRHGAKVHKVYDTARTPYQRLVDRNVLTAEQLTALAQVYDRLNPVTLRARIDEALQRLWTLAENP